MKFSVDRLGSRKEWCERWVRGVWGCTIYISKNCARSAYSFPSNHLPW